MHMVTRKRVKGKKMAKRAVSSGLVAKGFFGAPVFATTLFSGKKVYRLLNTHEKYTMHHSRPRKVL